MSMHEQNTAASAITSGVFVHISILLDDQ